MQEVLNNPVYRGYHVIVVAGKVFRTKTGERAAEILKDVRQKYPKKTPAVTYIPDVDTLIGFLERNEIPPLMGRHFFLETFETLLSTNHTVTFADRK